MNFSTLFSFPPIPFYVLQVPQSTLRVSWESWWVCSRMVPAPVVAQAQPFRGATTHCCLEPWSVWLHTPATQLPWPHLPPCPGTETPNPRGSADPPGLVVQLWPCLREQGSRMDKNCLGSQSPSSQVRTNCLSTSPSPDPHRNWNLIQACFILQSPRGKDTVDWGSAELGYRPGDACAA